MEALEDDRQSISQKTSINSVKRGGSLKNPTVVDARLPASSEICTFEVGEEGDIDDEDKPPSTAPPPPPDENEENNAVIEESPDGVQRNLNILRAIDDLDLRESASCNF